MCGIAGIADFAGVAVSREHVVRMNEVLAHRGPDGSGLWHDTDGNVVLGHRRLSILDIGDGGRQPMTSNDERYVLTYNGEVYNFIEVRAELAALGHCFTSESDSEVILAAFVEWGEAMLPRFNGMWAMAIYDTQARRLFLARDRFGVKPLYYSLSQRRLTFASEIRALRAIGVGTSVDDGVARRLLIDQFAPAAVLVNEQGECLYAMGPTDRYLRVTGGHPSVDLLDMARDGLRARLKSAIDQGFAGNAPVTVKGGALQREGATRAFDIVAQPVSRDGQKLLLICFIDAPDRGPSMPRMISADESSAIADLQGELAVTQGELVNANRNLEIAQEEQRAINEEALSVNEEHQSTNEELLTSKEELQSLNEELTALNAQLQETLTQQRRTSADLQNVLYSTDVATLFLDPALNIRFFTPATKLLFNVIPSDIGRPLSDLSSLSRDAKLLDGARAVLGSGEPRESEIETRTGAWYARRILPYRTHDGTIDGVVITFVDITDRRRTSEALASAERQAKLADAAKSRFLVAASHDLRQPLQSLTLLQGMLAKHAPSARAQDLVARLGNVEDRQCLGGLARSGCQRAYAAFDSGNATLERILRHPR